METSIIDFLFSPFEKEFYCNYFLIMQILHFITIFIALFFMLYFGITAKEGFRYYLERIMILFVYVAFYFQSRLLYSMCVHSL